MKKILLILWFGLTLVPCRSQDTVHVEGFLIERFLKEETLFRLQNEILKEQGKSFQKMIDYTIQRFYFSLIIDSVIYLLNESDIVTKLDSHQNYKNIEVFRLPKRDYKNFNSYGLLDSQNKFLKKEDKYFFIPNDSIYLYRIIKIQGTALRTLIENDYLLPMRNIWLEQIGISSFYVNKSIPSFFLYTFINIDDIDYSYPLHGFHPWSKEED